MIDGPRGLLQREAGLALFAGGGPDRVPGKDAAHHEQAMAADRGPAAETVRVCRAGVGPATPIAVRRTRPARPTALRLATTTALACVVWAGAVGTAVATTDGGPGLIHAIGKSLDFDGPGDGHHELHTAHEAHAKGDRS